MQWKELLNSNRGKRGIRKKSYAKCENSAHSDVKCTLIMARVVAPEIRQIQGCRVKPMPSAESLLLALLFEGIKPTSNVLVK
jgi:hypothetical protein